VIDGYLNLTSIAERLDKLVERRLRHRTLVSDGGVIGSAHGAEGDGVALGLDRRDTMLP
jgi:hypothetical protein